ncbi:MAG: glycosyl transferase family 25 [Oleiphilaceae bacterium]|jgi:glycosyl transferase family 25
MKIYVINLPASERRRQNMKRRLDSFDLRYEIIQAVSTSEISPDMIDGINNLAPRGGTIKQGEVACARSHSKALSKMFDDGEEVGVILEDDVIFDRRFSRLVKSLSPEILKNGPLLLGGTFFVPTRLIKMEHISDGNYHYAAEQLENVWGAMAYAIKKEDAERLSAQMLKTHCRSDDWLFYVNEGVIENVTICFPFVIQHEELNSDVAKFAGFSGLHSISAISKLIHKYRIFPFFQISIGLRQRRAERRQSRNIISKDGPYSKTYQLK